MATLKPSDEGGKGSLTTELRTASLGSRLNLYTGMAGRKSLTSGEERFLIAAEVGDIDTVRNMLDEGLLTTVDFADALGRTPLRLAIGKEHSEVVELLLNYSNSSSIREALLQAINNGNDQIAEFILKFQSNRDDAKERQKFGEEDYFFTQCREGSQFSADTTPLILAAWRNRFQIVLLLLRRGERIAKPHHCFCNCMDCNNKKAFDELRLAKTRLNAYRGLASEAYVSLSSKDPILEAFQLGKELRTIAEIDKCYKTEYLALAEELSEYVVKLLDKIRGHDELKVILDKVGSNIDEEEESFELLERFKLAIEYNEKKFVAHPICQQALIRFWYSDLRFLERANLFLKVMFGCAVMFFYPFLTFAYWAVPKSKIGIVLRSPCVKFISRLMSLLVFMVMILISSFAKHNLATFTELTGANSSSELTGANSSSELTGANSSSEMTGANSSSELTGANSCINGTDYKDFVIRQAHPAVVELLLALWIAGMIWQEVKQLYQSGLMGYFSSLFNFLDTAVLTLYLVYISLKCLCIWKVNSALEYFENKECWRGLNVSDDEAKQQIYWLIPDRFFWNQYDPENVSEGAFAIANIISFTRIIYIFPAHELLGPLQISLVRMAKDILTFIVIFLVLFVAFMVGLHNLYWYYPWTTRRLYEMENHNVTTEAEEHFGMLHTTFRTVLWASIGQGDNKAVRLGEFKNSFTEDIGYWIFGAYSVAIVIVLLNMLIAMMTRSFDTIQSEAHTEWKFARSTLYMEYIKEDCTLPVPFNIVPSPKFFWYTANSVYNFFVPKKEPAQQYHPGRIPDLELFPEQSHQSTASTTSNPSPTSPQGYTITNPGIRHFREQMTTTLMRHDTEPNIYSESLTYKRVMNRIIRRYMYDRHLAESAEDEERKQDGMNLRFELQGVLNESQREITTMLLEQGQKLTELGKMVRSLQGEKAPTPTSAHSSPRKKLGDMGLPYIDKI